MKGNTIATVSASRSSVPKRGELRRVSIEKADNGFMVDAEYLPPPSATGKENDIIPWEAREKALRDKTVHETVESAIAQVQSCLGGGKKESANHEAGESKGKEKSEGKKDKEKAG